MNTPDKEILISRVVDGVAGPADWIELDLIGGGDPALWRELAQAQRDRQLLDLAVGEAISVADVVGLPKTELVHKRIHIPAWTGWAAAAAVAFAAFVVPQQFGSGNKQIGGPSIFTPTQEAQVSPDDALKSYLAKGKDAGRVIRQLPEFVVLESAPAEDGRGYDVVYLRQIVERTRVESLKSYQVDEAGQKIPVPVKVIEPKSPV